MFIFAEFATKQAMDDANYHAYKYNESGSKPKKIHILDSTLREGEQHPGVTFSNKQRIQIAWMLDYFGVDQIEISPVVSPDHKEATRTILKQGLKADIVAHVRALKEDVDVALECDAAWMATYLGISEIHMKDKLRITRDEALRRAVETVEYAKSHGLKMRFTVEDGSRADPEFLIKVCKEITSAGVDRISIPDTVGILRPIGMYNLVKTVRENVKTPLDVHCHNDIGLALANALAGCDAGADQIHTTIDGVGERTGIPALAETAIALTYLYKSPNNFRLDMLMDLSRLIEQYTGIIPYDSKPIVGATAYKHKAGTHLAAILRNPAAYEPIEPKVVGNRRKIVFGELAGKNGAAYLMSLLGLDQDEDHAKKVAAGLKNLRMGDLLEIPLDDMRERKIINSEQNMELREKTKQRK
jgi:2-isopropylmalate synthase